MPYNGINLREIAYAVEDEPVRDPISEDESEAIRAQIVDLIIRLDTECERFAALREEHKDVKKPLLVSLTQLKALLRNGYRETIEPVYQIKNPDTGNMEFVRATGEVIRTRRLLPTERQEILSFLTGTTK